LLKIKSNKKKNIISFLIILFLISGFLQITSFFQKNQIFTDKNLFSEENVDNLNMAATIQPDWEVATTTKRNTTCTINKPSGTQEGDLLILHCTTDNDDDLIGPFGWTILLSQRQYGKQTTASWYKIAIASEPSSYDVIWSKTDVYVGGIIRITGHDNADPIQASAWATGTGDIINPSVTTTKDDTLIIGFHGLDNDVQGDNYTSTLESGPIALYARRSYEPVPNAASAGMYYEIQASPGASPTRTWDINGSEGWYAATVAINSELQYPIINIVSPTENEVFGVVAPNFTVEITDPNLDTMWYTMDGGNNYTFTENETINQAAWGALPDGEVIIKFYANNTLGDINFEQVNVIKDTSAPVINIVSPFENEIFGVDSPSFIVEITDPNLDNMWYAIFNGTDVSQNRTFTVNGTIDLKEWGALYNGTYTIRFYANDTLGNINFEDIVVIKDIYAIIIDITSPVGNEVFGINAPSFIVEITENNLNTSWYTLAGAPKKYIFAANGTINQTAWEALPDGIVTISFYANNTVGDINFEQVNVIKDVSAPIINIVSPVENEIFGVSPPNFTVEITDSNLDAMWYWIFNDTYQSLNITFTKNGIIDPTEWDALSNGEYTIRFYANDTVGNINFDDVNVTKDIYAIFIDIISPIENDMFGVDVPIFIVEITCAFLNITWYTVDGGLNDYTFTENGTINEAAWDALPDGVVTIRFYANNTLGDINFEQVDVIKDDSPPVINIISPTENEVFGVDVPSFSVDVTDLNLDTMWYTVNNSATKFIFIQDGVIDQTVWDALADGDVLLTFYANDTLGNLASEDIIIRKSTPGEVGPDIIPIIILVSVIGGVAAAAVVLVILIKKGKISLEKLSIRKPSADKAPTEKTET